MKKVFVFTLGAALLLSSCDTYTGMGAYTGANIGGILGSAIGGLSGGWRGSDMGTLIGMAGGAAVGAAIGSAADQRANDEYAARAEERAAARERVRQRRDNDRDMIGNHRYDQTDEGGYYDPNNGGDDRIDFKVGGNDRNEEELSSSVSRVPGLHAEKDGISISNVRFYDGNGGDNVITAGELCKISFEVRNTSNKMLYNVSPMVYETSRNRHIQVSQGISVERIAPGRGVRYTAMVKADDRLKDGSAYFTVSVHNPSTNRSVSIDNIEIQTRR